MRLNQITVRNEYPIPNQNEIFNCLHGNKFFSLLDATEGFHQLELDPRYRHITAFTTPLGPFQYTRVPFRMTNSPALFQRSIEHSLHMLQYQQQAPMDQSDQHQAPTPQLTLTPEILDELLSIAISRVLKKVCDGSESS